MKRFCMVFIALILCVTLAALAPAQVTAAANTNGALYISEVKVGMGKTSEEAAKELLEEGYTILTENGEYADLNEDAGTSNAFRDGPSDKIVYIGYKTTTDPSEAITDLAVMNMKGGYSVEEYNKLMNDHMEGEIKPFVDRFIAALNEYRENYNKPEDSIGHKRADLYRQLLNLLTDDDTGGKPLGDLLLKKTKYEMGDDAYNALSDAEKQNHADILTLLMQGNGRAILMIEQLVTKATDSADDTWLDRLSGISFDDLKEQIKDDNPNLSTEADVIAEMDKTYNDTARKLLEKWDLMHDAIIAYDDTYNEIVNNEMTVSEDLEQRVEEACEFTNPQEAIDTMTEVYENRTEAVKTMLSAEDLTVIDYLDATDYEDGTLLEFFDRDKSELEGEKIRELYPFVAALSEGQIAGLDFLTLTELFSMALVTEEGIALAVIDETEPASVYQDVDREIYKPGGVALTNKALRDKANAKDDDSGFGLSDLARGFCIASGVSAVLTLGSVVANRVLIKCANSAQDVFKHANAQQLLYNNAMNKALTNPKVASGLKFTQQGLIEQADRATEALTNAEKFTKASNVTYYLAMGFAVLTAVLSVISIVLTITEMAEYYNVTYTPIPKYMVDETDITEVVNGQTIMKKNETAYYKVAQCNRKDGGSDFEKENYKILGTSNDLNGDIGKQWLALYYVKYENGRPILADSFKVVKGDSNLPNGYETGIHRFGEGAAFNLTHTYYCYNDKPKGTFVYYKNADQTINQLLGVGEASTSGSLFSGGSLAIGAGVGIIIGGGIVALIVAATLKRKNETV